MSTASAVEPAAPAAGRSGRRATFGDVIGSEWLKLTTVRSTMWTLLILVVLSAGLSALIAGLSAKDIANGTSGSTHPTEVLTAGISFGQVAALVLGVLAVSSEYGTGMIRTSLTAMPRRVEVLVAKVLVLGVLLVVVGVATAFLCYALSNPFLSAKHIGVPLSATGVMRSLVGNGLYLMVLGLFGLALGFLIRHTAGAITVGLALIFVVGGLVSLLPGTWGHWVYKLMPANAGSQITQAVQYGNHDKMLAPWAGFAVFCGEVALLLIIGGVLFRRRDA
jgi:ABC-2 type transport system permease protein